jgi:hypothetical protein
MAKVLSKSNITNGNIILPSDVSQSIDALTGLFSYNITISGSLNLTGSTVTGSTANFAQVTASLFGTSSWSVSSSQAISASYYNATQVNTQYYDGGAGAVTGTFKFIAGKVAMNSGNATSSAFPVLAGKTLGTNAFVTANYSTATGPTDAVIVTSISSSGAILFDNNSPGTPNATVVFTGIYI